MIISDFQNDRDEKKKNEILFTRSSFSVCVLLSCVVAGSALLQRGRNDALPLQSGAHAGNSRTYGRFKEQSVAHDGSCRLVEWSLLSIRR